MKSASPALVTLLNSATEFHVADLLTIVQADGTTTRLTSADVDVTAVSKVDNASHVFSSSGPRFTRGSTKTTIGLDADSLSVTLACDPALHLLASLPWPAAVDSGYLDEARLTLERAFMPTWGDTSAGTVILFAGRVGQANSQRNTIDLDVKSELELLAAQMPRNVYQPGCLHTLFDAGCGLSKAAFEVSGAAAAGSAPIAINATLAQATDYFSLGTIRFTSGVNTGLSRAVRTWVSGSPGVLMLMRPFPATPAPGDAFVVTPGCDKQITPGVPFLNAGDVRFGTCQAKFSNLIHARAFPFVPSPESSL